MQQSVHAESVGVSGLTDEQKKRVKSSRDEALERRKKRVGAGSTDELRANHFDDPEGESWEQACGDGPANIVPKSAARAPALTRADKHTIASTKLKEVKAKADATWQTHISSSARIAQLTEPAVLEPGGQHNGPARFEVHPSHRTMALRSVVFCKSCGYWSSKKSQKLQIQCLLKPPHSDGVHKLKRMVNGMRPDRKVLMWPGGLDTRIKTSPVPIDWVSS